MGFALFGQPFPEYVFQLFRRKGAAGVYVGGIFGQHHKVGYCRDFFPFKTGKIFVGEAAGKLTCAVCPEIHKDQGVAVIDGNRFALWIKNYAGGDKLIVFIPLVGSRQGVQGICVLVLCFAANRKIVGGFYPLPTLIPVHGVVTAADRSYLAVATFAEFILYPVQRALCAARRRIPAVEKGMQIDLVGASCPGQLYHGDNMVFMAVDAARRQQAKNMHRFILFHGQVNRAAQGWVLLEFLIFYGFGDTGKIW